MVGEAGARERERHTHTHTHTHTHRQRQTQRQTEREIASPCILQRLQHSDVVTHSNCNKRISSTQVGGEGQTRHDSSVQRQEEAKAAKCRISAVLSRLLSRRRTHVLSAHSQRSFD